MSSDQLPSHAYIPGQNKRHPENAFESIRHTAVPGKNADQLAQSNAFQIGLLYLKKGYYWEAHEVLEPVWMALPKHSIERGFVQGLIQLANGRLKMLMGRPKATIRLVSQARELVPANEPRIVMTLDVEEVHTWIDSLEVRALSAL